MKSLRLDDRRVALLIPLVLLVGLGWLMSSPLYLSAGRDLSAFVTVDLLFTVPFVYFLCIRRSGIPVITVMPVVLLGVLVGTYLLPEADQAYLGQFKRWALPAMGLLAALLVGRRAEALHARCRALRSGSGDFYTSLKAACREALPRPVADAVAGEVAVLYYSVTGWTARPKIQGEFTHHRACGTRTFLWALAFIIGVETLCSHLLVSMWSPVVANVLIVLSLYSLLQITGYSLSLTRRCSTVIGDRLVLRFGMMQETTIPLADIESLELTGASIEGDDTASLSILGELEGHNAVLTCRRDQTLYRLFGLTKTYRRLSLTVDERDAFAARLASGSE